MYISRITLQNFRSFSGEHCFEWAPGINFLVGNNNCGKTTIFKAVDFIQTGKSKSEVITKGKEREDVSVEIEITGNDLLAVIENEELNLKKYRSYVIDNNNGSYSLRILRSSVEATVKQGKKETNLSIKNIRIFNPSSTESGIKRYENPTGVDKTIAALFDAQYIYSDIHIEDYQDFGKTKMIGKIISEITADFQKEVDSDGNRTVWGRFKDAHAEAFGDEGIVGALENFERDLSQTMKVQYGEGEVQFAFNLPEIDSFIKAGEIMLSDNGVKTAVDQKGTGMQRALALSLIQLYSQYTKEKGNTSARPTIFFIDEPETFLHPVAQNKLINALSILSESSQIFLTTHSPYFLKNYDNSRHRLTIFYRDNDTSRSKNQDLLDLFGNYSPTWGEINYFAYGILSIEFHNELYGFLQAKAVDENVKNFDQKNFDNWLDKKGIKKDRPYVYIGKGGPKPMYVTLPSLIRNIIHHPENNNNSYTDQDLSESIEMMIRIIQ